MIGQRIGNYQLVAIIGQGGMGAVYEAVRLDTGGDQRVALKILPADLCSDADLVQRFFNEARALRGIQHPGVVRLHDYGQTPDGTVYLSLERLYGETLLQRLQRNAGALPITEALTITRQLAEVLCAVHAHGLVHRDIKPGNVFLARIGDSERVKLLDFGLVKVKASSAAAETVLQTRVGLLLGTPEYMPPEQCQGLEIGPPADVYALGVMLYRLCCGQTPFTGTDPLRVLTAHIQTPPPPLRERLPVAPAALDTLLAGMLRKDPRKRPTMAQVIQLLAMIEHSDSADRTILSGESHDPLPGLPARLAAPPSLGAESSLWLEVDPEPAAPNSAQSAAPAPPAATALWSWLGAGVLILGLLLLALAMVLRAR